MANFISIEIIRKYLSGNCSQEEANAVIAWFNSHEAFPEQVAGLSVQEKKRLEEQLFERIMGDVNKYDSGSSADLLIAGSGFEAGDETPRKLIYKWLSVAASLVVFFSAALYLYNSHQYKVVKPAQIVTNHKNDTKSNNLPQANKAILTLANGTKIDLNNAKTGAITRQGQTTINKTKEGIVAYNAENVKSAVVEYNVMTTPKGSKYELVLPDGTKVCLNAASSIRFPTAFVGKERDVELSGEGYFEVAKNKDKPFNISVNGTSVQVLGTHFDISAYKDDDFINTTLIEGSVRIKKNNSIAMLQPGYQAVVENGSDRIALSKANIDKAIAWKNGYFVFTHEDILHIMKKVSRWYDVDVVDKGKIKTDQRFSGIFERSKSVDELLSYLEKLDAARFIKDGRRVTIMN